MFEADQKEKLHAYMEKNQTVTIPKAEADAYYAIKKLTQMERPEHILYQVEEYKIAWEEASEKQAEIADLEMQIGELEGERASVAQWLTDIAEAVNTFGRDPMQILTDALRDNGLYLNRPAA